MNRLAKKKKKYGKCQCSLHSERSIVGLGYYCHKRCRSQTIFGRDIGPRKRRNSWVQKKNRLLFLFFFFFHCAFSYDFRYNEMKGTNESVHFGFSVSAYRVGNKTGCRYRRYHFLERGHHHDFPPLTIAAVLKYTCKKRKKSAISVYPAQSLCQIIRSTVSV